MMTFDISRGADSESGKTFMPDLAFDQYVEDAKDEVYFSKETILEHASDCIEAGQFILDFMTEYFLDLEEPVTESRDRAFAARMRELGQQLRNDTTDYVVRNA
jgi:hypothetical protein